MDFTQWYVPQMNVRNVNDVGQENQNTLKTLLILDEISKGELISQRDLSKKLDLGLGLVNSYIKNLIAKGYLRVSNISKKSFKYFLTPQGVAEKTRLSYDLLREYNRVFREARSGLKGIFQELQNSGARNIVFAGADEVAEIAYLSLQDFDLKLAGVVDSDHGNRTFFKHAILPFGRIKELKADCVLLSSFVKRDEIYQQLIAAGIPPESIKTVFPLEQSGKRRAQSAER